MVWHGCKLTTTVPRSAISNLSLLYIEDIYIIIYFLKINRNSIILQEIGNQKYLNLKSINFYLYFLMIASAHI